MTINERVRGRLTELLQRSEKLRQGSRFGQVHSEEHRQECSGWLAAAAHIARLVSRRPTDPYPSQVDAVLARGIHYGANQQVGEVAAILFGLQRDIDLGLLTSIANQAAAETFDDFLDQAKSYLDRGQKNEGGVIAGVVFEDSVRLAARNRGLTEKGIALDELISELAKGDCLTGVKAKRARSAAAVRTKATHAQWDEFDADDVRACIEFTRELIDNELS